MSCSYPAVSLCLSCKDKHGEERLAFLLTCGHSTCSECSISSQNERNSCPENCEGSAVVLNSGTPVTNHELMNPTWLCSCCSFAFSEFRRPMIISFCGHSICSICLEIRQKKISNRIALSCPIDNKTKLSEEINSLALPNKSLEDSISTFKKRKCCKKISASKKLFSLTFLEQACDKCVEVFPLQHEVIKLGLLFELRSVSKARMLNDRSSFEQLIDFRAIEKMENFLSKLALAKKETDQAVEEVFSSGQGLIDFFDSHEKKCQASISKIDHVLKSANRINQKIDDSSSFVIERERSIQSLKHTVDRNQQYHSYLTELSCSVEESLQEIEEDKGESIMKFLKLEFNKIAKKFRDFKMKRKIFKKMLRTKSDELRKLKVAFKESKGCLKVNRNQFQRKSHIDGHLRK